MLAIYFSVLRDYVLLVFSQRKYNFYHQNTLLDDFRTNSRNIIGRDSSLVIHLLANQDMTPMLAGVAYIIPNNIQRASTNATTFLYKIVSYILQVQNG